MAQKAKRKGDPGEAYRPVHRDLRWFHFNAAGKLTKRFSWLRLGFAAVFVPGICAAPIFLDAAEKFAANRIGTNWDDDPAPV